MTFSTHSNSLFFRTHRTLSAKPGRATRRADSIGRSVTAPARVAVAILSGIVFLLFIDMASADVISPYKAQYEYKQSLAKAQLNYTLSRDGEEFVVSTHVQAKGAAKLVRGAPVQEESRFRFEDGVIVPLNYSRDDGTSKGTDNATVVFDWDRGIATGSDNQDNHEFEITRGESFDILTAELATRVALSAGGEAVAFDVIEGPKKVRYTYTLEGQETLSIGKKSYETVHYVLDRQSKRKLHYWFVPEMDYLVVRMEQRAGDEVKGTITLESIK